MSVRKKQAPGVVTALVKCANDESKKVKKSVATALFDIGRHQPTLVLEECDKYLKVDKLTRSHRIALLTVIHKIVEQNLESIADELALSLIATALGDMVKDKKEVIPEWQGIASECLVALGMRFPKEITDKLLALFGPGDVPHYFVMKTLGDMSIANPIGMVPLLSDVLARMLPVLAMIKADNLRWVFAAGIGHVCEAIVHFIAAEEQTQNPDMKDAAVLSSFAPQIYACFELMLTNWVQSKNLKVRLATIQAIGATTTIMTDAQLELQLARLIPVIHGMFKKEKSSEHLPITQGYRDLLSVATREAMRPTLEPLLEPILNVIFPLACRPVDYSVSSGLKNNNELLRSLEILASAFIDPVLNYIFAKLEAKEAHVRTGGLVLLKHLVTRIQTKLLDRKELLVSAVKKMVPTEKDWGVKKALAQVIISMANEEYLHLEGGEALVEFIILNSSIPDEEISAWTEANNSKKKSPEADVTSPGEIRGMCDHVLTLMTTTMPPMLNVLWPFLLEPLTKPEFNHSMAVVSKSIAHIAEAKRQSNDANYVIDFSRSVNVPRPEEIVARMFVLVNLPNRRGDQGLNLLKSMLHCGPILHPALPPLWDSTIPKLIKYLETTDTSSSAAIKVMENKWTGLIRRLLTETLKTVGDDKWMMAVGDAMMDQLSLHVNDPECRKVTFKLVGVILQISTHKDFLKNTLAQMFKETTHSNELERAGCAQGFGYTSLTHLDVVLEELTKHIGDAPAPVAAKKESGGGGGFFSSFFGGSDKPKKSKGGGGGSALHTVLLAYGYVAINTKPALLPSRLDIQMLSNLKPHLGSKSPLLHSTLVQAMDLIAQAVNPSKLKAAFTFSSRDDFISSILTYISIGTPVKARKDSKSSSSPTKGAPGAPPPIAPLSLAPVPLSSKAMQLAVLSLNALTTLLLLLPPLSSQLEARLLSVITQYMTVVPETDASTVPEIEMIHENLDRVIATLLVQDPTIACMNRILKQFLFFVGSPVPSQRSRSLRSFVRLLKKMVELFSAKAPTGSAGLSDHEVVDLGSIIATLLPRCTDPTSDVRGYAIEGIQLLLFLQYILKTLVEAGANAVTLAPPKTLSPFTGLRKRMVALEDQNEQFGLAHTMASMLAAVVDDKNLPSLVEGAVNGLIDAETTGARGTCVVLFGLVTARGGDLGGHVTSLVHKLLKNMQHVSNDATLNGSLHALRTLAKQHLVEAVDAILSEPLPHPPHVTKVLQLLARDQSLIVPMIQQMTDVLNNGDLLNNEGATAAAATTSTGKGIKKAGPSAEKTCTQESMGATVCLGTVLSEEEAEEVLTGHFALFFGSLLLRVGTTAQFNPPEAADQLRVCWENFFNLLEEEDVLEKLVVDGNIASLAGASYHTGVAALVSVVCRRHMKEKRNIFKFLLPFLKANYDGQRVVTAFALAEMVSHVGEDTKLLDLLVTQLLNAIADPLLIIPAIRGLGNVATATQEQVNTYSASVLDALMGKLDSPNDSISLEAMNSLAKLFPVVQESHLAPILINVCHRIRPAFDHGNPEIRASAAALFGALSRFGTKESPSHERFTEQVHELLPAMILHINDDDMKVQTAFRHTFAAVGVLLDGAATTELINAPHMFSVDYMSDYHEFLYNYFSKAIIADFPERLNNYVQVCISPYFASSWDGIQANAAYFVGTILIHLPEDKRKIANISPPHTAKALIGLLSSPSVNVRGKAAEALSMLHDY